MAKEMWRAVCAAISTEGRRLFDLSNKGDRATYAHLVRVARSILVGTVARGESEVKRLKAASSQIRADVFAEVPVSPDWFFGIVGVLGWTKGETCLQLSYIGRALPFGSRAVCDASIQTHRETLSIKSTTPPELLSAARLWASRWSKRFAPDFREPRSVAVQESSSLEFSRKDGGLVKSLQKAFTGLDLPDPSSHPDEVKEGVRKSVNRLRASWFSGFRSRSGIGSKNVANHAVVVPVAERGFKCRVVTAHAGARVAYMHQLRRGLFESLKKDGRVREVANGQHRAAVLSACRELAPDGMLLSADLTAASDRIPSDLLKAILLGVLEHSQYPLGLTTQDVMDMALGPYVLHYPDGSQVETQQGVLMGLPTTWPLLCLVHLFWVDLSQYAPTSGNHQDGVRAGRESERICGDDLVAWWRPSRVQLYESIAVACGASFSKGKHLKSSRYGIFTEEIFSVRQDRGEIRASCLRDARFRAKRKVLKDQKLHTDYDVAARSFSVDVLNEDLPKNGPLLKGKFCASTVDSPFYTFGKWARCIPLRWAVRIPRRLPGCPVQSLPDWFCLGPAATSVANHTRQWKRVDNVRKALYPGFGKTLSSYGIPPFLSRALGGGGLPTPKGDGVRIGRVCSRRWRRALGGGLYRSSLLDTPANAWTASASPAYSRACLQAQEFVKRPDVIVTRNGAGVPQYRFHRFAKSAEDELEARSLGGVLWAVCSHRDPLKRDLGVSPFRVRKALDVKIKKLLRLGGFLRFESPVSALLLRQSSASHWIWLKKEEPVTNEPPTTVDISARAGALMSILASRRINPS
uniref:RdRp n=1 Tax=Erysiphe necator associated narnavirus 3 TaxID=2695336 RepID=A0A7U3MF19_9VIRU|nr:RdRp [Erysiphe necator associated narnavirus 3]